MFKSPKIGSNKSKPVVPFLSVTSDEEFTEVTPQDLLEYWRDALKNDKRLLDALEQIVATDKTVPFTLEIIETKAQEMDCDERFIKQILARLEALREGIKLHQKLLIESRRR